jgi:hypothetical protein
MSEVEVEVELDVYSGRPNPTWSLTTVDAARLDREADALPVAPVRGWSNGLGYRGFVVTRENQTILRVQDGTVELTAGGVVSYRVDVDRALERWLLSTGRDTIDVPALAAARQAIG